MVARGVELTRAEAFGQPARGLDPAALTGGHEQLRPCGHTDPAAALVQRGDLPGFRNRRGQIHVAHIQLQIPVAAGGHIHGHLIRIKEFPVELPHQAAVQQIRALAPALQCRQGLQSALLLRPGQGVEEHASGAVMTGRASGRIDAADGGNDG
jgi:hypothetical protein